ncbi:hypothetical protein W97_07260 [Coniosporium apollinis CBS 100218]|uniref:Uncharacterized protein n=1 Tax=Coniosporium apollinis (strain CBS 100218) TaxID=1168221 RepID=R7Z1V0_CONA1|nr:uncharacterized protein W97_07260 [Coniosporium apollinis CBS 100218]EON68112.1 hypothetical protein W97_07260 [Coniosporium apollinis CBS 100218]
MSDPTDAITTAFESLTAEDNGLNGKGTPKKVPNEQGTGRKKRTYEARLQKLWSCGFDDVVPASIRPKNEDGIEKKAADWPMRVRKGIVSIARLTKDIPWVRTKLVEQVHIRGQPRMAFLTAKDVSVVLHSMEDSNAAVPPVPSTLRVAKRAASDSSPDPPTKRTKAVEDPEDMIMEDSAFEARTSEGLLEVSGQQSPTTTQDLEHAHRKAVKNLNDRHASSMRFHKRLHGEALEENANLKQKIEQQKQQIEHLERMLEQHGLAHLKAAPSGTPYPLDALLGELAAQTPASTPPASSSMSALTPTAFDTAPMEGLNSD